MTLLVGPRRALVLRRRTTPAAPVGDIRFGDKTRAGFGGVAGFAGLSITGGTGASDFTINADGHFVPSGTYGAAKTFSLTSYTLSFSDGQDRTIQIIPNTAHVRSTSADTNTANQIITTFANVVRGDTVIGRDGSHFNPAGQLWRISNAAAWATGTGRILFRSETALSGTDADGNPIRGGGFKLGGLAFNTGASDPEFPIDFEDLSFWCDDPAAAVNFMGPTTGGVGWGWNVRRCSFEYGPNVPSSNVRYGPRMQGGTVEDCYLKRVVNGITGGRPSGDKQTISRRNVFKWLLSDAHSTTGSNILVEENFAFDFKAPVGAHPDCWQSLGNVSNLVSRRNVYVLNDTGPQGPQGDFASNNTTAITGLVIEDDIIMLGAPNSIAYYLALNPVINRCLVLRPMNGSITTADAQIWLNQSTGGTITDTVANVFNVPADVVKTNCITLASGAATLAAFPNFPNTANPGITNRAAGLLAATPANLAVASGGMKRLDGTYCGPLNASGQYQAA